jgi:hypothetical protein
MFRTCNKQLIKKDQKGSGEFRFDDQQEPWLLFSTEKF